MNYDYPGQYPAAPPRRRRGAVWGVLAVLGGAIAGAVIATTVNAGAASTSVSDQSPTSGTTTSARASYPAHGTAAHEAMEKPVSGATASKAQAAAVAAVGRGKAGAVTTDVSGSGYEVTVTKSDGSTVEIHLDQSFNVAGHAGG